MVQQLGTNTFTTAKWIVSSTASNGTHTTIATALTSASSGDTIFIRPGTYTENLTLKAGVNLSAFDCDALTPNVTISGTCTFTTAGTVTISGINLQTNSAFAVAVTGSAASILKLKNCFINALNNTAISYTSSSSSSEIDILQCNGNIATTGIAIFSNSSSGTMRFIGGQYLNSGNSTTANTVSAGGFFPQSVDFNNPFTISGTTAQLSAFHFQIVCSSINATALTYTTTNATGGELDHCTLRGGTASALSVGAGATLIVDFLDVQSSNTNAITGSGTIQYGLIVYTGSSSTNNASTQTALATQPSIGGTGSIVQQGRATSTTKTTTATTLALTGVTPTTANTVSLISLTLTPTKSTNTLIFDFSCPYQGSAGLGLGFFLFSGTTLIASFPYQSTGASVPLTGNASFRIYATAGTTSSTTYAVYYAGIGGSAFVLQNTSSTAFYNGNIGIHFMVTEVVT